MVFSQLRWRKDLSVFDIVLVFPEQLTESTRFPRTDARCSFLMSLFYLINRFVPGIVLVFFDQLRGEVSHSLRLLSNHVCPAHRKKLHIQWLNYCAKIYSWSCLVLQFLTASLFNFFTNLKILSSQNRRYSHCRQRRGGVLLLLEFAKTFFCLPTLLCGTRPKQYSTCHFRDCSNSGSIVTGAVAQCNNAFLSFWYRTPHRKMCVL